MGDRGNGRSPGRVCLLGQGSAASSNLMCAQQREAGKEEKPLLRMQKELQPTHGEGQWSLQLPSADSNALSPYDPFLVADRGHFRDLTHE